MKMDDHRFKAMWKILRVSVLLLLLGTVIQQSVMEDADLSWDDNFYVALYPINADGSPAVKAYIDTLAISDFEPVAEYFAEEGKRYGVGLRRPIELKLGDVVGEIPPAPPEGGAVLQVIWWSLKLRYFAWAHSPNVGIKPDIRLYLLYHHPDTTPVLGHSTALHKGRVGRVNLFGSQAYNKKNLVILAHELLHTVKATDKYELATTLPIYPDGYVDPHQQPLYPQQFAELMAGRIPITAERADIPSSLKQTLIGEKTAREIGWIP